MSADDLDDGAAEAVAAVYRAHAGGLVRLAVVILGDHAAAESRGSAALARHLGEEL